MTDDFSDISDGKVISATQLVEKLYGDSITDANICSVTAVSRKSVSACIVCLSVGLPCLHNSKTTQKCYQIFYSRCLCIAVACSSSAGVAISLRTSGFVDDLMVLWRIMCIPNSAAQNYFMLRFIHTVWVFCMVLRYGAASHRAAPRCRAPFCVMDSWFIYTV